MVKSLGGTSTVDRSLGGMAGRAQIHISKICVGLPKTPLALKTTHANDSKERLILGRTIPTHAMPRPPVPISVLKKNWAKNLGLT